MFTHIRSTSRLLSSLNHSLQCSRNIRVPSNISKPSNAEPRTVAQDVEENFYRDIGLTVKAQSLMVLDSYSKFIKMAAKCLRIEIFQELFLNPEVREWVILKSPFKYKKHMVKYRLRTHGRLFTFQKITGTTADIYIEYIQRHIPPGVSLSVKKVEMDRLPYIITKSLMQNKTIEESKMEDDRRRAEQAAQEDSIHGFKKN